MNREIKFRAWLVDFKKMETSLFGMRSDGFVSFNSEAILMQYTGLKDKNGVDIYEKDVLKVGENFIGVVCFKQGSFIVENKSGKFYYLGELISSLMYESLGNIYENQELLNQEI